MVEAAQGASVLKDLKRLIKASPLGPLAVWLYRGRLRAPSARSVNERYDRETVAVMKEILRPDSCCIDVGAHRGTILEHMARIAPRGTHYAFEPLPPLAAELAQRFPAAQVVAAAVSDRRGRAEFVHVENDPAYSGLQTRIYDRPDPILTRIQVEVTRIDDAIPPDTAIALIKLDIEGGEYHALLGAAATIRRCRPVLIFEAGRKSTGQYGIAPEALYRFVTGELGYRLSTMQRWLAGQPGYSEAEFVGNWHHGSDFCFIAHPPERRASYWRRILPGSREESAGWRRSYLRSHDTRGKAPWSARFRLRRGHPRLLELKARYARLGSSLGQRSHWNETFLASELDLRQFRGDNGYLWQYRQLRQDAERKFETFARYVAARDPRGLLERLREDGRFGCWTFRFEGLPLVSRDLLDSINEIYFLDRHLGLFERDRLAVLDIGAGYGRLAHRMEQAVPGLSRYLCVDGIPESTFLSEYYLAYRRCLKARVVPLDELDPALAGATFDLAVNIHSFSEMAHAAIEAWLRVVECLSIPYLLIVPNDQAQLLSIEADGTRRDFAPLLPAHGYELAVDEPVIEDADVRAKVGNPDRFLLFRRRAASC
jgi:FkbM family methyltransferase